MQSLDLGDVLGTTLRVITAAFVPLLIIVVVCLSPVLLFTIAAGLITASAGQVTPEQIDRLAQSPGTVVGLAGGGFALWVLMVVLTFVSQGAMLHATIEQLVGRTPTAGASLRIAFSRLPALIGSSMLVGLVVLAGTLLCIVPGIILGIMYFVTIPVVMAEGLSGGQAMSRASALTEGSRWMIFLTWIITILLVVAVSFAFGIVAAPIDMMAKSFPPLAIVSALVQFASSVLTTIVSSVVVGVIYVRLRGLREGIDVRSIADVFG